jgi:hypothetical protein
MPQINNKKGQAEKPVLQVMIQRRNLEIHLSGLYLLNLLLLQNQQSLR